MRLRKADWEANRDLPVGKGAAIQQFLATIGSRAKGCRPDNLSDGDGCQAGDGAALSGNMRLTAITL